MNVAGPAAILIRAGDMDGAMEKTDSHLEASLEGLNDRVNELESAGASADLMEAYVNRGCVLSMLGYRTSALDDLESAAGIASWIRAGILSRNTCSQRPV